MCAHANLRLESGGQAIVAIISNKLMLAISGLALVAMPEMATALSAGFSWAGIPACSSTSPAFQIGGVPSGTKRLRFNMIDQNAPNYRHGGSTIDYAGAAVKKGAISYIGPCPPAGQRHSYTWTIEALDASGTVLGKTTATKTFPP